MFNVLVITEHEVVFLDITHQFYSKNIVVNIDMVKTWRDFIDLKTNNNFDIIIIDFPSKVSFDAIVETCKRSYSDCLIYVIFDNLNELLISDLIHKGAYSFALKSNLESLVFSITDGLKDKGQSCLPLTINRQSQSIDTLFEHALDPFWIKDTRCKYMYINSAGARFISKPIHEIIGKYDFDVFPQETAHAISNSDQYVLQTGQTQVIEQALTNAKAVQRTFQAVKTVFRDGTGKVQGIMGTIRDITDHKQSVKSAI